MSAGFTRGPWEIGDRIGFGRWGGYRQITSEHSLRYGSDERKVFALADAANARLIAAAPELFNGCNALLGLLQLLSHRDDISDEVREFLTVGHRIDEAEAAVAKARGEQVSA